MGEGGQTLQSVELACEIVGHLSGTGGTSVTDLARELDLPKSTAHVYLKTLCEAGYLHREAGSYRVSLRMLEDGAAVRRQFDVYDVAQPMVKRVSKETGEVASLGVEEGGERVLLYKSESEDAVYDDAPTGEFTNMHWTSLGKAILAHLPPADVDRVVDRHGLPAATGQTITERAELSNELERVRDRGYAVEDEEHRKNIRAVAVPIHRGERVVGALSVSGPKTRFGDERIEGELLDALRDAVSVVELKLEHY